MAAVVSTCSAINAALYGAAKFTYLMGRDGELSARFGRPVGNRPLGGLLATTAGTPDHRQHGQHRRDQPDGLGGPL